MNLYMTWPSLREEPHHPRCCLASIGIHHFPRNLPVFKSPEILPLCRTISQVSYSGLSGSSVIDLIDFFRPMEPWQKTNRNIEKPYTNTMDSYENPIQPHSRLKVSQETPVVFKSNFAQTFASWCFAIPNLWPSTHLSICKKFTWVFARNSPQYCQSCDIPILLIRVC